MNWPLICIAVFGLVNLALCVIGAMSLIEWFAR